MASPPNVALPERWLEAALLGAAEQAALGIAVTLVDGTALRQVFVNESGAALLGCTREEFLARSPFDNFVPEWRPTLQAMVERLAAGDALEPVEVMGLRRDGTRIPLEFSIANVLLEGRRFAVSFFRDVTERSRMQQQLARADRLASLGTLAAGVAHEVNNPLTFMALGLELCARRVQASALTDAEKEHLLATLADVRGGADRVALVVRDLKTFSRVSEDERQAVDVREVIDAAVRIVAHRSRHFAEVAVEVGPLPRVAANGARLEQVLVNLLLNAVQAFDEARPDNRIEVRGSSSTDGQVVLDVIDNGPGVPADVLGHIFDPFFTTKPVGEGTGLGLAVVHGLLAQIGGTISVLQAPRGGAQFRVTLPVASANEAGPSAPLRREEVPATRSRILVIDDEREVASVIKRSLEPKHDVVAVTTAAEGLSLLLSETEFDVVLCDLAMPAMSGTDLYRAVTRERPDLGRRFIIITGGAISGRMQGFLDAWSGPRLEKPFTRRELEAAVLATLAPERAAGPRA
jgi:PAS domain S-box-containing protein